MKAYGIDISHATVSKLAKVAHEEVLAWRNRPLAEHYCVIFVDAFYFPLKRDTVEKEAVYVAIGVLANGSREILGFDIPGGSESASNWRNIFRSFKKRGVKQVDFIVADGLTGIKNVIEEEFKNAHFQYCVLHATRTCSGKVRKKDRSDLVDSMKMIYQANSLENAKNEMDNFEKKWNSIYPKVVKFWKENFENLTVFMNLPNQLWKYLYTTNTVERLHKETKRRIKVMEQFQTEESAMGVLYMLYSDASRIYEERRLNNWEHNYSKYMNFNKQKEEIAM